VKDKIIDALKKYDFSFIMGMTAIFIIGLLNLYSAAHSQLTSSSDALYQTQLIWFGIAVLVAFSVSFISAKTIFRYSYFVYFLVFILIALVLVIGKTGMGATRWIQFGPIRFQPSEFMKIALVVALARWYTTHDSFRELTLRDLIVPCILAVVPAGLIMGQPDLGTGGLLILIFLIITFYRRLKWSSIIKISVMGFASALLMYNFALKDYQKKRIEMFINPYKDAKGSGYNAIQSAIAIGSGRFLGKGYMKSSQASLSFLPENHTDFVFAIYNEEHGFLGSVLLIFLYVMLVLRFIWLARSVSKVYESILTVGVMSIFFWHTIINMSMVTGLMPIVGIPLPFMSYGGSSLLTFGICIGVATSISNQRTIF
jgi:rod shape determining protein RodA